MRFESKMLTVGTKPKPDWVGKQGKLIVKFNAAENHNVNEGTEDNPEWVTRSTSWFPMTAWEDVAQEILDAGMKEGWGFACKGVHKIKKVQRKNEKARYYNQYTITEITEIYEKRGS